MPTFRSATPDDAPVLASLLAGGALTATERPDDPEPYRRALAEIAATDGNDVVVAVVDGRVVGVCQLLVFRHLQRGGGRCAELESFHVEAGLRGGGIGSALLAEVVRRAGDAGCYRVQLTSNKQRTDAHRFYERHGFERSHEGFKLVLR